MTRKTKTTDLSGKRNMTNQFKHRMSYYKKTLSEQEKTVKLMKKYTKYNLPNAKARLIKQQNFAKKLKLDIANLRRLIKRRIKNGEIFKVE